jgi:hypothetical protein
MITARKTIAPIGIHVAPRLKTLHMLQTAGEGKSQFQAMRWMAENATAEL